MTIRQRLQELREWHQSALEEEELRQLLSIRQRVQQGDTSALYESIGGPKSPKQTLTGPDAGAPRPEKPTQFNNRDRAQYNRWERECEATFRGSPKNFSIDALKIDFGLRYISESLRSAWEAASHDNLRKNPAWRATWTEFKTVMLNALGPPEQRKLSAHKALKILKQDWSQDPNDLLSKLDTHWTELGDSYTEEQRKMDFIGAMVPTVQKELLLLEPSQRSTISEINARARLIWDRNRRDKLPVPKADNKKSGQDKPAATPARGSSKTRKRPGEPKGAQPGADDVSKTRNDDKRPKVTCHNCGKVGHTSAQCWNLKPETPKPDEAKTGKDKGRKV